jgi:heat shock protein HspQ
MPRKQSHVTPRSRKRTSGAPGIRKAKYALGQVVRHRVYAFRGVVFDIDPVFNNTEDWYLSIPAENRPVKDQPFYHLLAENSETEYIAYVSEQNLLPDESGEPLRHPQLDDYFIEDEDGRYRAVFIQPH